MAQNPNRSSCAGLEFISQLASGCPLHLVPINGLGLEAVADNRVIININALGIKHLCFLHAKKNKRKIKRLLLRKGEFGD